MNRGSFNVSASTIRDASTTTANLIHPLGDLSLALFARTFKEAQTYLSMLMLIPMMPAMFISLQPIKATLWMMAVPVLGQTLLMSDVLRGEASSPLWFILAAVTSAACAAFLLAGAARMLRSEKIVFGRSGGA